MRTKGLSLIELLIAIGILAIALTAFTSIVVSNLRYNSSAGARTQAAGLLDYFGRKVTTGDSAVLPPIGQTSRSWSTGSLLSSFPDLRQAGSFANPNNYSLQVSILGAWSYSYTASTGSATVALQRYRVQLCWQGSGGQECVNADTLGPQALASGSPGSPLPGIN